MHFLKMELTPSPVLWIAPPIPLHPCDRVSTTKHSDNVLISNPPINFNVITNVVIESDHGRKAAIYEWRFEGYLMNVIAILEYLLFGFVQIIVYVF